MLLQKKQVSGLIQSLTDLQTSISGKVSMPAVESAISAAIAAITDGAPTALDTLHELATALQNEETALNALILTVDGKVAKADVATHADAIAAGFESNGTVASQANIEYILSLFTSVNAEIQSISTSVELLTDKTNALEQRVDGVEMLVNDIDQRVVSRFEVKDFDGVTLTTEGFVAGYASLLAVKETAEAAAAAAAAATVGGVTDFDFQQMTLAGAVTGEAAVVSTTDISRFHKIVQVGVNGQLFPVSKTISGFYIESNSLKMDESTVGFALESTDKVIVYGTIK